MTRAGGEQPLGIGLEQVHGVERAGPQRGFVLLHRPVCDRGQRHRIHAGATQIVGKADPRRRYLGNGGKPQVLEIDKAEVGSAARHR